MPKRYGCDLSHFSFMAGDIGKLQTLSCIPVMAGDSMKLSMEGVFRLSPLRRNLVVDCNVDVFAFYVPHRQVYGEQYIDFIKAGVREEEVFPFVTDPLSEKYYLGTYYEANDEIPLWVVGGYNRIWNRYFRSPTDDQELADTDLLQAPEASTGKRCGHLPTPWSTGVMDGVDDAFRQVSTVGDSFDIVDLNRIRAEYRTDVEREYFGQRYNDILNTAWGSTVNTDADERPTLVGRNRFWLSGYDVDGTADATLGSYSGKSATVGHFGFKRKFFPEHGALWVMALLRFPTIHVNERPFLMHKGDFSYLESAGDPQVVGAEPPVDLIPSEWFGSGHSGASIGQIPYGQHYRYHPSHVHPNYRAVDGFSFLDEPVNTRDLANYIGVEEYDDVFQTLQLRQWQMSGRLDLSCQRAVPPSRGSLFAGG